MNKKIYKCEICQHCYKHFDMKKTFIGMICIDCNERIYKKEFPIVTVIYY